MDNMEKELWDAFYGKTNSQKRCAVLTETRKNIIAKKKYNLLNEAFANDFKQGIYNAKLQSMKLNFKDETLGLMINNYSSSDINLYRDEESDLNITQDIRTNYKHIELNNIIICDYDSDDDNDMQIIMEFYESGTNSEFSISFYPTKNNISVKNGIVNILYNGKSYNFLRSDDEPLTIDFNDEGASDISFNLQLKISGRFNMNDNETIDINFITNELLKLFNTPNIKCKKIKVSKNQNKIALFLDVLNVLNKSVSGVSEMEDIIVIENGRFSFDGEEDATKFEEIYKKFEKKFYSIYSYKVNIPTIILYVNFL